MGRGLYAGAGQPAGGGAAAADRSAGSQAAAEGRSPGGVDERARGPKKSWKELKG